MTFPSKEKCLVVQHARRGKMWIDPQAILYIAEEDKATMLGLRDTYGNAYPLRDSAESIWIQLEHLNNGH